MRRAIRARVSEARSGIRATRESRRRKRPIDFIIKAPERLRSSSGAFGAALKRVAYLWSVSDASVLRLKS